MKRIIRKLSDRDINLEDMNALEFFARDGEWQTKSYGYKVKSLSLWEIDPKFLIKLKENFPDGEIMIGNSFELAHGNSYKNKFDLIVFDNPQGIYGGYCEHFEALELTPLLLSQEGLVIFNVNKNPFDYDKHPIWAQKRRDYYGKNAIDLETDFLLKFYKERFNELSFDVNFSFEEKRNEEYLSYLIFSLTMAV